MSNTLTEPQIKRLKIFIAAVNEGWSISYAKGVAGLYKSDDDCMAILKSETFKRLNDEYKMSKGRVNFGRKRNNTGI